jgi:hypothetical protein
LVGFLGWAISPVAKPLSTQDNKNTEEKYRVFQNSTAKLQDLTPHIERRKKSV